MDGLTDETEDNGINIEDSNPEEADEKSESILKDLSILSIGEARDLIRICKGLGNAKIIRQITETIINPDNNICARAGCDEIINLISDYTSLGDQYSALIICDYYLKQFQYNADLLSYGVLCSSRSGQFDKGQKYIDRRVKISYKKVRTAA